MPQGTSIAAPDQVGKRPAGAGSAVRPLLPQARGARLRRPGRTRRVHASRSRRAAPMDRRGRIQAGAGARPIMPGPRPPSSRLPSATSSTASSAPRSWGSRSSCRRSSWSSASRWRTRHRRALVDAGAVLRDRGAVIATIAIAAYKLGRSTNRKDPLLWGIFTVLAVATVWAEAELAELFILAGLVVLLVRAWSGWRRALLAMAAGRRRPPDLGARAMVRWLRTRRRGYSRPDPPLLYQGRGLRLRKRPLVVPFLHQGVVQQFGWLTEQQFVDAVAVAMITPGPVVITVAFIGYLVASFWGALLAAVGSPAGLRLHRRSGPMVPAKSRQRSAQGVRPGRHSGGHRRHHWLGDRSGPARRVRRADCPHGSHRARGALAVQDPRAGRRTGRRHSRGPRVAVDPRR